MVPSVPQKHKKHKSGLRRGRSKSRAPILGKSNRSARLLPEELAGFGADADHVGSLEFLGRPGTALRRIDTMDEAGEG
jgi:hypothetical protein